MDQAQLNKIRSAAGLSPVYTRTERDHLAETAKQKDAEKHTLAEAANNRAPGTVLAQIARQHLGIRNLKAQNSDERDFHECSVWAIEAALKAAFKAGQASAPKTVKEGDESSAEAKKGGTDYDPKGGERYPAEDQVDPDVKKEAKGPKKGKSAENYDTPKNKNAKQVSEAKKADKDHDGDGKVESSEDEHKGAKNKAIKKAMEKNKETGGSANKAVDRYVKKHGRVPESADKRVVKEMDLDMDMGDEGASDLKQRRMDLIRKAVEQVRGAGDIVDVGDEEMGGEEGIDWPEEHPTDADYEDQMRDDEAEMSGEMDFGGGDADYDEDEEDCGHAMGMAMPEDEEAYSTGFDAFRKGMPNNRDMGRDWNDGYETARFTRMAAVAEGSSEGYNNPKGKAGLKGIEGSKKTGADAKVGKDKKTVVKEGAADATVFDKDYHSPVNANGHWDMAQHEGEPHVQGRGQEEKVKVPKDIKSSLKEEITSLRTDAGKIRYRDEYRADFYENTAEAFETLLHHLEEGTVHSLLLAQIDMNRVMSPMTERLPRDVYLYIVRGGKPASLGELFREVKVNTNGADLSKTDYNK